jgi:hypothetical protein
MISSNPRENLEQQTKVLVGRRIGQTINSQPLGRIVALAKRHLFLFYGRQRPNAPFVHRVFSRPLLQSLHRARR